MTLMQKFTSLMTSDIFILSSSTKGYYSLLQSPSTSLIYLVNCDLQNACLRFFGQFWLTSDEYGKG